MKIKILKGPVNEERKKPGPKPFLKGDRLNFLPGERLRDNMDSVIKAARKQGEKLTYAYILREGAIKEVKYIKDMLRKVKEGRFGAKKREALFAQEEAMLN